MTSDWIASPPVAIALFLGVAAALHWLGGRWAPRGKDSPGKRLPYACGEDLTPGETQLSYKRFFRLALMFVVVHMGTLVAAMLPGELDARLLVTIYVVGVAVCVDVLVKGEG